MLNAVNVVDRKDRTTVPFPYDLERRVLPVPFLPEFPEESANSIITISIKYEDLMKSFNDSGDCPRTFNNEIWGCDVYTDDTDPILALRHCGFTCLDPPPLTPTHFKGKASHKPSTPAPLRRTPVNQTNKDNVVGEIPKDEHGLKPFDLDVDILLLPRLQQYFSVKRYGITSRHWGKLTTPLKVDAYTVHLRMSMHVSLEENIYPIETMAHDGLSYGIHKIVIKPRTANAVEW